MVWGGRYRGRNGGEVSNISVRARNSSEKAQPELFLRLEAWTVFSVVFFYAGFKPGREKKHVARPLLILQVPCSFTSKVLYRFL